jgi:hypothetical protein
VSDTRRSRSRFAGHRRPTRLLKTIVSVSSKYQTTAWSGLPSGLMVATIPNRGASRKRRAAAERVREGAAVGSGAIIGLAGCGYASARW